MSSPSEETRPSARHPTNSALAVVAATALVLAAVAGGFAYNSYHHHQQMSEKPALPSNPAADFHRTVGPWTPAISPGQIGADISDVARPDGTLVRFGVDANTDQHANASQATLSICTVDPRGRWLSAGRNGMEPPQTCHDRQVRVGDAFTDSGLSVKVLKIWRMTNSDDDAVDLSADPAP